MRNILTTLLLFTLAALSAQQRELNLIPQPKEVKITSSKLVKPIKIGVKYDENCADEWYKLTVKGGKVDILTRDKRGEVWARQTLAQLTDKEGRVPQVEIVDYPAFPIRGFMHDTGRNFIQIEMIKEHLKLLSKYKLNVFHWHLTDNPAWRIECRAYPQLNDPQYQRKGRDEGCFYTYDQIRDVIGYARELGIMVIPEIDMPGHSQFFDKAFGFHMDAPEARPILEACLREFFEQIPVVDCPYFHVGSDEVSIKDPKGFMSWLEGYVSQFGRKIVAWDPGLPTSKSTIRQIWNQAEGANTAAAKREGAYLDSFVGYLNYYDPMVFTNRLFFHTPCLRPATDSVALGGILCLWNDVNVDDKSKIALHSGMVEGVMTFGERFWSGGETARLEDNNVLPPPASEASQRLIAFQRKMSYHRDNLLGEGVDMRWVATPFLRWSIRVNQKEITAWGGAVEMDALLKINNISIADTMAATACAGVYVARDTTITAWVGFEAPARSNRISGGVGEQGQWENGGKVWVNGTEIVPPKWREPGKYKYNFNTWHKPEEELAYTDEQFYFARETVKIPLTKGWNQVVLNCPKTFKGQRWSFAFIPVMQFEGVFREAGGLSFE